MKFFESNWKLLLFLVIAAAFCTFAVMNRADAKGYDKSKDRKRTMKHWRPLPKPQEPQHVNPSAKRAAALPASPKHP